jgi:release factor glutamine methyltransferase
MFREYSIRGVAFKSMKRKSIKFAAMTIHEANMRLIFQLYGVYDNREAGNIADLVMEKITGWKRIDRVTSKHVKMSSVMVQQLDHYTNELLTHKPVQYVLNEAWFAGMKLYVDENVLIPRPETEELVDLVVKALIKGSGNIGNPDKKNKNISFVDIGTGSGCIPIAIKKKLPQSEVYAVDISIAALDVARKNAGLNNAEINFVLADILDESKWDIFPPFDFIVSNPPYIPLGEISMMQDNVTRYEPHIALFVPDDDPLMFYKAIARFAENKLLTGGKIVVELHENFAEKVKEVFSFFRDVDIKNDMQGKKRFLVASIAHPSYRP